MAMTTKIGHVQATDSPRRRSILTVLKRFKRKELFVEIAFFMQTFERIY